MLSTPVPADAWLSCTRLTGCMGTVRKGANGLVSA